MKALTITFLGSLLSINLLAIQDPKNLLPEIDSYISESFHSAFQNELHYDYSSQTCFDGKNCDKFFLKMKTHSHSSELAIITMFEANNAPIGSTEISKSQWSGFKNSIFRRSMRIQSTRYSDIKIEGLNHSSASRYVNGVLTTLNAIDVDVSMRDYTGDRVIKVFTLSNQVRGLARILTIREKHYKSSLKNIVRTAEHIIQ